VSTIPSEKPATFFASAERADTESLREDAARFATNPLLQSLLDAVPDIFMILNEQRQIVYANRTMLDFLGWKELDIESGLRPGDALDCDHSTEVNGCGTTEFCRNCGAVRAILSSLRGVESVEECRIIQHDGNALDLRVWATPLTIEGRKYSVFAVNDISDEKRRRALERIFFHDVLNTAGTLSGFVQLMQGASYEELDEYRSIIGVISQRLLEEIEAQRDLSAAESSELAVVLEPVNALDMLREVGERFSGHPVAEKRNLMIDDGAQAVIFESDFTLLGRVLSNLVKNALEASAPAQTVTLSCGMDGDWVAFRVHNDSFMPRHVQQQLFQRSFSTKGGGRGLGTYSIKLLSERYLKGDVSFVSSQAEGTTFTVRFPSE
jgi:signal transduction histidine kinase